MSSSLGDQLGRVTEGLALVESYKDETRTVAKPQLLSQLALNPLNDRKHMRRFTMDMIRDAMESVGWDAELFNTVQIDSSATQSEKNNRTRQINKLFEALDIEQNSEEYDSFESIIAIAQSMSAPKDLEEPIQWIAMNSWNADLSTNTVSDDTPVDGYVSEEGRFSEDVLSRCIGVISKGNHRAIAFLLKGWPVIGGTQRTIALEESRTRSFISNNQHQQLPAYQVLEEMERIIAQKGRSISELSAGDLVSFGASSRKQGERIKKVLTHASPFVREQIRQTGCGLFTAAELASKTDAEVRFKLQLDDGLETDSEADINSDTAGESSTEVSGVEPEQARAPKIKRPLIKLAGAKKDESVHAKVVSYALHGLGVGVAKQLENRALELFGFTKPQTKEQVQQMFELIYDHASGESE